MFGDVGATIRSILHDYDTSVNYVMTGTDVFAVEGTSAGEHRDGSWRAGVSHAGRRCDVFEVRDFLIQRSFGPHLAPDVRRQGHRAPRVGTRAAGSVAADGRVTSVPGRRIVHPAAADHRRHDLCVEILDRVAVEHDEIREVAGQQLAAAMLVACEPGRVDRGRLQTPARR